MTFAAVACAKLNSARVPGKSLKLLAGKPLLQHTIDFARMFGLTLYVMGWDELILEYAAKQGCPVIFEPAGAFREQEGFAYEMMQFANNVMNVDQVVLLQPTQPVRDANFILRCLREVDVGQLHCTRIVEFNSEKDTGLMYTYSRQHLMHKEACKNFYFRGTYFNIDTQLDFDACERYLCERG